MGVMEFHHIQPPTAAVTGVRAALGFPKFTKAPQRPFSLPQPDDENAGCDTEFKVQRLRCGSVVLRILRSSSFVFSSPGLVGGEDN